MWFRLAALWGCTIVEAQARCNAQEFAEWQAYYGLEPWGEQRADLRAAIIAHTIYCGLWSTRKSKELKLSDFLAVPPPKAPQSVQSMVMIARAISMKRTK